MTNISGTGSGGLWKTGGMVTGYSGRLNLHKEEIMAKFLSGVFTDIRGSVGGLTFGINKGVMTAKAKPNPVRRLRTTQPSNRSILGFLSRNWGELTSTQRGLWESYAEEHPRTNEMGQDFIMSGINAYTSLNHTIIRLFGYTAATDAPPTEDPIASVINFVAATGATDPGDVDLSWSHLGTPSSDDKVEIRIAGPFISEGKTEVDQKKVYHSEEDGNATSATIASLVEGQWYWFFIRYVDEYGQVTAWQVDQATPKLTV